MTRQLTILFCLMACSSPLGAQQIKETYSKEPLPEWSTPKSIPLFLPVGKYGLRALPGYQTKGFRYTYDRDGSKPGELRLLEFERTIMPEGTFNPRARWITIIHIVKLGELLPIAGSLYRWDGSAMIRVESDLTPPVAMDKGMAVVNRLSVSRSEDKQLHLDIKQFGKAPLEKDGETVQAKVWGEGLQLMDQPIKEANPTLWLKVGDRVKSPAWEVKLHRIVRPNPEQKIQGWAEFVIEEVK